MANSFFQFKQFRVEQQGAAMKVGTDGVLLGAWAPVTHCHHILDIGTGTGLIALMCAQRNSLAVVDAIDIDKDAVEQASFNFSASPWGDRLNAICDDVANYALLSTRKYDLIVCNPPFFVDSVHATDNKRNIARHDVSLSLKQLAKVVSDLLTTDGCFAVVLPPQQIQQLETELLQYGYYPNSFLAIKPTPQKEVKRFLGCFSKNIDVPKTDTLVVEAHGRHNYSDDYKSLTEAFYLSF